MSERAKDALKALDVVIDGLEVIQGLTRFGGDGAKSALELIDKAVTALRDGLDGKTSPEIVRAEITSLRSAIADNDAAIDAAARHKFDASTTE